MLPFLMSEMMRGLPGFLLAGDQRKKYFLLRMYEDKTELMLFLVVVVFKYCIPSLLHWSNSCLCFFFRTSWGAKADDECWYRPVLFRHNEVCTLLISQAWILWITEHRLNGELQREGLWGIVEQCCPLLYVSVPLNSPLMVMPSSTPLLLGSLTWKVPLLGTTDSG